MDSQPICVVTADQPIDAQQLAERFRISLKKARAWLVEMPHIDRGRRRWTTEAWLAGYLATHVQRPVFRGSYDPLEEVIHNRVVHAVEKLAEQRIITIHPPQPPPAA